jgi:hypothetical protein
MRREGENIGKRAGKSFGEGVGSCWVWDRRLQGMIPWLGGVPAAPGLNIETWCTHRSRSVEVPGMRVAYYSLSYSLY